MPASRPLRLLLVTLTALLVGVVLASGTSLALGASVPGIHHQRARTAVRTALTSARICGTYCDGSRASVGAPYRDADSVDLSGRTIRLSIDDTDHAAYAVIGRGDPGDEVWLDRSWDGGRTWDGKLGDVRISRGARSARTTQWNLANGRATAVVRACGKAGNRQRIACTGWNTSPPLPAAGTAWDSGAVDALMVMYDKGTGLWRGTGWWNSANALTSLIDYIRATHDRHYRWVIAHTFDLDRSAKGGDFTNSYLDDTGWWALAWIRAYDLTKQARYLRVARTDVDHMWRFHDGVCGGGLWWSTARKYKNAITNELFIKAAAELHLRVTGDRQYLRESRSVWRWFRASGMINGRNLVNDGLDTGSCANNHDTTWTYNQGVILGGLVDLARATHHPSFLAEASALADASTTAKALNVAGVLTEPCETADCGADGASFKGIYARNLGELARATSSSAYRAYLRRNAQTAYDHDRTAYDQYGVHWAGPVGPITSPDQQSAVDLMVAALH